MQVYSITLNDLSETNHKQLLDAGYLENAVITIILDDPPKVSAKVSKAKPKSGIKVITSKPKSNASYEDRLRKMVRETFTENTVVNPSWSPVILDEFNKMFKKPVEREPNRTKSTSKLLSK